MRALLALVILTITAPIVAEAADPMYFSLGASTCSFVGEWDADAYTCTLSRDIDSAVAIEQIGFKLDGNGHTIRSPITGQFSYGLKLRAAAITVKNITVQTGTDHVVWVTEYAPFSILEQLQTSGVVIENTHNIMVTKSTFSDITSIGLRMFEVEDVSVTDSTFACREEYAARGVYAEYSTAYVASSTFQHCGIGVLVDDSPVVVRDTHIHQGERGIVVEDGSSVEVRTSLLEDLDVAVEASATYGPVSIHAEENIIRAVERGFVAPSNYGQDGGGGQVTFGQSWYHRLVDLAHMLITPVYAYSPLSATVIRNDFIDVTIPFDWATDPLASTVLLSQPVPTGGNYWSAYDTPAEGCVDENRDLFCDAAYRVFSHEEMGLEDAHPRTVPVRARVTSSTSAFLTLPSEEPYDGARGVVSSGPYPERGVADKDTFTFKVVYTDTANRPPITPRAVIMTASGGQTLSLMTDMTTASTTLNDGYFANGELLTAESVFPKGEYTYHFETTVGGTMVQVPTTSELSFKTGYDSVVFIPGAQASRLYDGAGTQRWEPESNLDAYAFRMQNGVSVNTGIHTQDIIETSNMAPAGFNQDIYASFANSMRDLVNDGTIAGFDTMPYDWRYAVDTTASGDIALSFGSYRMLDKLHELAASSDSGRVTIVSHSMGGLIGKLLISALEDEGRENEIGSFVMVAVPQLGTPKAVASLLHGEGQKIGFGAYLTNGAARELGHDMPNAYGLLPGNAYFDRVTETTPTYGPALTAGVVTLDASLASLSNDSLFNGPALRATYGTSIRDKAALDAFLRGDGGRTEWNTNDLLHPAVLNSGMLADARALRTNKLDHWTAPSNIRVVEIAGWGEETITGVKYYKGLKTECAFLFMDCTTSDTLMYKPFVTLDGDGTVVEPSAMAMMEGEKYWVNLRLYNNDNYIATAGGLRPFEHSNVLEVNELPLFVKHIIINTSAQTTYVSSSKPPTPSDDTRLHLFLHSPLTLDLYDDEGHHTGVSSTTGLVETNVPGSRYHTLGELKWITVPASIATHLVLRGETSGSFTLDVEKATGDVVVASTTFAGVPSSTSTVVTLDIPADTIINDMSPLSVDHDGDGTTDFLLTSRLNGTVVFDQTPPEARISVDVGTHDLKIEGVDREGTTSVTQTGTTTYLITDSGGHTTKLFFAKSYSGKLLTFAQLTAIQYDHAPVVHVPKSSFLYVWNPTYRRPQLLSQTISVNQTFSLTALYNPKKNITSVVVFSTGNRLYMKTFAGLKLVTLTTNKGVVGYDLQSQ